MRTTLTFSYRALTTLFAYIGTKLICLTVFEAQNSRENVPIVTPKDFPANRGVPHRWHPDHWTIDSLSPGTNNADKKSSVWEEMIMLGGAESRAADHAQVAQMEYSTSSGAGESTSPSPRTTRIA